MSTVCSWEFFCLFCSPITPQVFALMRRTHSNDSMLVSCMFLNGALSPNNAKSTKAPIPARPEMRDCGEKMAHRGRIDWLPGKCFAFPQRKKMKKERNFFSSKFVCVVNIPHAISFWNMIPGSLLPLFSCGQRSTPRSTRRSTFTFLTKRYNVVLSFRTTRVRVPLARNPSPLQYPTSHVQFNIPLDLCYANQDLH